MFCTDISLIINFDDKFPKVRERRIITTNTGGEYLIDIISVKDMDWYIDNGTVVGAKCKISFFIDEVIRQDSKVMLKLVHSK